VRVGQQVRHTRCMLGSRILGSEGKERRSTFAVCSTCFAAAVMLSDASINLIGGAVNMPGNRPGESGSVNMWEKSCRSCLTKRISQANSYFQNPPIVNTFRLQLLICWHSLNLYGSRAEPFQDQVQEKTYLPLFSAALLGAFLVVEAMSTNTSPSAEKQGNTGYQDRPLVTPLPHFPAVCFDADAQDHNQVNVVLSKSDR
jgi:hypothetical protein